MSDSQIIQILGNTDMFQLVSPINLVFRYIGWWLIKILAFLSNGVETVINEIYSLNNFFSSKYINDLINDLLPLIWVILAISIVFLGIKIIFDREFKVNSLIKNIVVAVSVVMLLPMGMDHLEKITSQAVSGLKTEYKLSANKIIKENFYDLYYLDTVDFNSKLRNNIPVDMITSDTINIIEEIDTSEVENKDVFKYKVSANLSGQNTKQELSKTFFGLFSEKYYRFSFDFWGIFISLACTTITLLATSFKVARIIFELGFVKLFGILYSFADIANGQKIKEIIRCIVSNFVVLFSISVLLKMYLLFTTWSIEKGTSLTQSVLLIGASVAVIDGPNIIERILGIDSGVKSGWSVVTAGYAAAKSISAGGKVASDIAGRTLSGVGVIGSGAVGMMNGFDKSLEEQMAERMAKSTEDMNVSNNAKSSIHDEIQSNKANTSSINDDFSSNSNNTINTDSSSNADTILTDKVNTMQDSNLNESMNSVSNGNVNTASGTNNNDSVSTSLESDMSNRAVGNGINTPTTNSGITSSSLEGDMRVKSNANINDELGTSSNAKSSIENDMNNSKFNSVATDPIDNKVQGGSLDNQMNNVSNEPTPTKGSNIETRTLSDHIKNNMMSNPTIKGMQQSYNIGKNTGYSLLSKKKTEKNN